VVGSEVHADAVVALVGHSSEPSHCAGRKSGGPGTVREAPCCHVPVPGPRRPCHRR
jgi:hypothetical protein